MALNTSIDKLGIDIKNKKGFENVREVTIYPPVKIVIEGDKCGPCNGSNKLTKTTTRCNYFGADISNGKRCSDCIEHAAVYHN